MGVEEGFQYIRDGFVNTDLVGASWVIPLMVILISLVLVTRDTHKWKILAFPMSFAWLLGGLRVNMVILMATGIMFVIETVSLPSLGKGLQIIAGRLASATRLGTDRLKIPTKLTRAGRETQAQERALKQTRKKSRTEYKRDIHIEQMNKTKAGKDYIANKMAKVREKSEKKRNYGPTGYWTPLDEARYKEENP